MEELERYIRRFAKPSDKDLLLKLSSDKREEVSLVSQKLLAQMFPKVEDRLKKMARSKSPIKRKMLRLIVRKLARKADLSFYRGFANVSDKAEQIIYVYCLGEVGTGKDLRFLSDWVTTRRRNKALKAACWFSISRIANRLGDSERVWLLINKKDRIAKIAALEAITREGIGPNFKVLFSKGFVDRYNISDIILDIATPGDTEILQSHLSMATLDYDARDLVLALCKIGGGYNFQFLFDLFSKYKDEIQFRNHVRVADSMAKICTKKQAQELRKFVNSKEFWSYILREQARTKNRLPVVNTDNQVFMRRIIAACIIEKGNKKDTGTLIRLLWHDYKWIANRAAEKLSKISGKRDLDKLTQDLWQLNEDALGYAEPALYALCLLDRKLYLRD